MLVFDGQRHIGQLQFRPYIPHTVSPNGLHHPIYWMDYQGYAPDLPRKTLALFCYHVGQTDNTQTRDPQYFGKGIGLRLLNETLKWAKDSGFEAVVAKGCPGYRPIIEYMGGMPIEVYREKGFEITATYIDQELKAVVKGMDKDWDLAKASEVGICVKYLSGSKQP
jgi:GNAT superfamily N-acetyltransferase